jgi:hypothetical protein
MKNSNSANPTPTKLDGPEVLKLIEGCRGNMSNGIGVALMASLNRISPELHSTIVNNPTTNKSEDIINFFKEVSSEAGYVNVPKNFKK